MTLSGQQQQQQAEQQEEKQLVIEPTYYFMPETLYFGFTPVTFTDSMVNLINEYAQIGLNSLEQFLRSQPPFNGVANSQEDMSDQLEEALEKGMQMAGTLLESAIDKNFDRWELFCLNRVFRIPNHVQRRIPALSVIAPTSAKEAENSENSDKEKVQELKRELEELCEMIQATQKINQQLRIDTQVLKKRAHNLNVCQARLGFLKQLPSGDMNVTDADSHVHEVSLMQQESVFLKSQWQKMNKVWADVEPFGEHVETLYEMYRKKVGGANTAAGKEENETRVKDAMDEDAEYARLMNQCPTDNLKLFDF